ncbi:hypothetical protein [Roseofilum casamattae]|uniref:Rho termination factor n=1 Tax=Roseofilum casamattae BLCC-M143 TaxID=3022442 RepID=A0ABT7BV25_9CYAN|nr:hypothetical protein [Roseofilum casamattae]MDJ1183040.1 Rho termination factor [Roseofilum casamattae BLCC-M143]
MKQEIGALMYLYLDEIEPGEAISVREFQIKAAAKAVNEAGDRNWLPIIVKQTGVDKYRAIANMFAYAVAEEAGLEKVWCIIADDSETTAHASQLLSQEKSPQIDLATATREEIKLGLDYLIGRSFSPLKGVTLAKATSRIDEAPRQYWKSNLMEVTKLGCGITKAKLAIFKEVFYVTTQPLPDVITDLQMLNSLTVKKLQEMAQKRGLSGFKKWKKAELVKQLSQE